MSGHRWNNRFNPPLETASVRFPRAPIEPPQVPANRLTRQIPGAPALDLYTSQLTQIPDLSLSFVTSNAAELTVTLNVSFGYRMKATDHFEFTFTNSNTGISTTKSFQQDLDGNYTIGEFDPGTNYFVYVTPVINGLFTVSSTTAKFLSSKGTAPGVLQGVTLTGSGSYAIIDFAGVYPSSPFPDQIAVNTNFGDPQVLVDVSFGSQRIVVGPYTNGASYQFILTTVTKSDQGLYRYGSSVSIPLGNNYFIPGPPGTVNIQSIYAQVTTVNVTASVDILVHPPPVSYEFRTYTSTLSSTLASPIVGTLSNIRDLETPYPGFSIVRGLISESQFDILSSGVASCNLIADITDNTGVWYSFRVTNISAGNVYTFTNPNLTKTLLTGISFSVNFNTLVLSDLISEEMRDDPSYILSDSQTATYTTIATRAFANNVYSAESDYATIFAGPPAIPINVFRAVGNQFFQWTLGYDNQTGPRPINYIISKDGTVIQTISGVVATVSSGLSNYRPYTFGAAGYANGGEGATLTVVDITPTIIAPRYLTITHISNTTVTLLFGRPLGGSPYGYFLTSTGLTSNKIFFHDVDTDSISVDVSSNLGPYTYVFKVYSKAGYDDDNLNDSLSAVAPGSYALGSPNNPSNIQGTYLGSVDGMGDTVVTLIVTASWGGGPIVTEYNIRPSYDLSNPFTISALPNYDMRMVVNGIAPYQLVNLSIAAIGNTVTGNYVSSPSFDFDPQPPTSADLFMTGTNGQTMNISFSGVEFPFGQTTDYYSISATKTSFGSINDRRRIVRGSPASYPAVGSLYQFAVYTTICGITSSNYTLTPVVSGGQPFRPNTSYTLGNNQITFLISVSADSAVKISNYFITEYYQDVSSRDFLPTGTTYTIPVTPSLTPVATYTISGVFTTSYSVLSGAYDWSEAEQSTPNFGLVPTIPITDPLALSTYPNIVTLTLSQNISFSFPVTSFGIVNADPTSTTSIIYTNQYSTSLTTKPPAVFDKNSPLRFIWRSGTGPFTGGTYRYDIQSLGNEALISPIRQVSVNLYVAAPGQPSVITNNASATVTFAIPPTTSVPPEYFVVSDNYGRTISGATNLSSFVFTNCITGSAYSYFVTTYAQGISSAPSQLSSVVYPGRPGAPNFQASFYGVTGTISTLVNQGPSPVYIPVSDICLRVVQGGSGYTTNKTSLSASYTVNGPTYTLTNLSLGSSYTFTLSAYANQVYSTSTSTYSYYVGSIKPNIPNRPLVIMSNTTATVSVSAAIPTTQTGGVHPDTYVFNATGLKLQMVSQIISGTYSYTTEVYSPQISVVVSGGGGGLSLVAGGVGGRVSYTYTSIAAGTVIQYTVGSVGTSYGGDLGAGGGGSSRMKIGNLEIIAGGGGGSAGQAVGATGSPGGGAQFGGSGGIYYGYNTPGDGDGSPGSGTGPSGSIVTTAPVWEGGRVEFSVAVADLKLPVVIPYNVASQTYTATFPGLTSLSDYTFSGYTITAGLSYGSSWTDDGYIFNAGGPRPITNVAYSLPAGTPVTQNVSLQVVITTGDTGVTGLWADTSYYINVSSGIIPGVIVCNDSTPRYEEKILTTIGAGNVDIIVAGGGGGSGGGSILGSYGGAGGLVRYTFSNISAGTNIRYYVGYGGGGGGSVDGEGGGGFASYVKIGTLQITAGGGGGGSSPSGNPGLDGGDPFGGAGSTTTTSPGMDGSGGPVGFIDSGGGGQGGVFPARPNGGSGYVTITYPGYPFSTMTLSSYIVSVSAGNTYVANVYGVKNQVVGSLASVSGFIVPPTSPAAPTITLTPTPNLDVVTVGGSPVEVLYATYPRGSTQSPPYVTLANGDFTVAVAGGGGGGLQLGGEGGNGGRVTYTFSNVPAGTPIYYAVGQGGTGLYSDSAGGGGGSAVQINDVIVFAGGGGGAGGGSGNYGTLGAGGSIWGGGIISSLADNLPGQNPLSIVEGGYGGGNLPSRIGGGLGGTNSSGSPGSGGGPPGTIIAEGGGGTGGSSLSYFYGSHGFIRILYSPAPTPIPTTLKWSPALTSGVTYYYSINGGSYVNNDGLSNAQINLGYGGTYGFTVYSQLNGISSGIVTSPSAYVYTNPPTTLTYGRTSNIVTLSWGSAFQPPHSSNIVYTASSTINANVGGISIRSTGGPSVVVGSNIMPESLYLQVTTAAGSGRPIVVTLSGISTPYYRTYQVTSCSIESFGSSIIGYQFDGSGASLTSYTGSNIMFSITNPSALPTNGYIVHDLCSRAVLASNIYSNSVSVPLTLGNTYDIAVQAFNLSMYSVANSARTGLFVLETNAVATLSATYFGTTLSLAWTTPTQFGGVIPTTTPPYIWTIFDASGNFVRGSGSSPSTRIVTLTGLTLGRSYTYSIVATYYGISSATTYANQVSLRTTPTSSVTQTTLGQGIIVAWQTASQSVYLPESPTILSSLLPNGGYSLTDLCGNYTSTISAGSGDTEVYIPITAPPYNYYNFAVRAIHNGISSTATAPGPIYLGVGAPTSPTITRDGMLVTLTWNPPLSNGPNVPYVIYDTSGYPIGSSSTQALRTIICNSPGIYSFTSLIAETIAVTAAGAGGSVGRGGLVSNTYLVTPGTTIVAKVGAAGAAGDSTTVYVPNFLNPQLILDAGGGGGFTVSGEGFVRNGGLPYPDGGPPGQPGYGSGGNASLGGGSPPSTDGQVAITMTNQAFVSSISTPRTTISFLVTNNTIYNFQIVSYSNGLTATADISLNTIVPPPSGLETTFDGIILSNKWNLPTTIPSGYLLTNLTTGTYNQIALGTITNQAFTEAGVPGSSYRFALYSVYAGIPSATQIIGPLFTLFSTPPSNFMGTNVGTTVVLTASGVPGTPLETFTLTDGSGNIINSGIRQSVFSTTSADVQIPVITGLIPGRTYTYKLYGITNGLSSVPVSTTVGLVIPGSISLGRAPALSPGVTIEQSVPGTYNYTLLSNATIYATLYGAGGGSSMGVSGGAGGRAEYIYTNIPTGCNIQYTVGGVGPENETGSGGGGNPSTITIIGKTIIAGGGGGSGGLEESDGGGAPYGGAGGGTNGGEEGPLPGNPGSGGWDPATPSNGIVIATTGGGSPPSTAGKITLVVTYSGTGTYKLTVNQCVPPADSFRVVSTNLTRTIYSNLPTANWVGVAMEIDGGTVVAVNNATNGSNIYISTDQGLGWGAQFTAGLIGATATSVSIAANGTWATVTTSEHGLWVTSNVSIYSPWFQVGNTVGSNIGSAGFSPDGSRLIVGQKPGYLYSISSSQLGNPSPVFTGGQGVSSNIWNSIAWSGEGNMAFAAPGNTGSGCLWTTTGGTFWTAFTGPSVFTSISPNSNGTYVLVGGTGYPNAFQRNVTDYTFLSVFPGLPTGLPSLNPGKYVCACSYTGDIQLALVSTGVSAYASYDFGSSWVADTRFSAPGGFTGAAVSSNGFVQVVVGLGSKLQTMISTPIPSAVITTIPIATTAQSATSSVPIGATGYDIIPYFKNIPGPDVFLWTTPQLGANIWGQTTGPASFTSAPYASGYDICAGKLVGYFVINNTTTPTITSNTLLTSAGTATLALTPTQSNVNVQVFSLSATTDLYPGLYTARFLVTGSNSSTSTITIPLRSPSGLTLTPQTEQIYGNWTAPNVVGSPEYTIYSNGSPISNTFATSGIIQNTGVIPTLFGVAATLNGVTSTITSLPINPPPPPAGFSVSGYVTSTTVRLTWTSNPGTIYYITASGTVISTATASNVFIASLPFGSSPTIFGVAGLSNNLLGAYSYVTATNRIAGVVALGTSTTITITSPFIITSMQIIGGGGGGGGGGYGASGGPGQPPNGLQGGGGGGHGGIERFTDGTGPVQSPATITLVSGKSGTGGLYGGGGIGGQTSYVTIGGNVIAWAGGGGGGGGGNGGSGSAGGRIDISGTSGNGGSGGSAPLNSGGGEGGYGGWGSYISTAPAAILPAPSSSYDITIGSSGQNRQGTPPNATTGGAGGGPDGGAAQTIYGGTGNYATGYGGGGGGGARSADPTGNPSTAPRGGPGGDGYISISYAYLTS